MRMLFVGGLFLLGTAKATLVNEICGVTQVPTALNTVKLNLHFSYDSEEYKNSQNIFEQLRSPANDEKVFELYQKNIPGTFHSLGDGDFKSKDDFIKKLKSFVANKTFVNFNYSGHGVTLPIVPGQDPSADPVKLDYKSKNMQWFMPLPIAGIPADCMSTKIQDNAISKLIDGESVEGLSFPKKCMNYYVSASELLEILQGKKVFGLMDACRSSALLAAAKEFNVELGLGFAAQPSEYAADDNHVGEVQEIYKRIFDGIYNRYKIKKEDFVNYRNNRSQLLALGLLREKKNGSREFRGEDGKRYSVKYGPHYEQALDDINRLEEMIDLMTSDLGMLSSRVLKAYSNSGDFDANKDGNISFGEIVKDLPVARTEYKENDHYLFLRGKQNCCRSVGCDSELGQIVLFPVKKKDVELLAPVTPSPDTKH